MDRRGGPGESGRSGSSRRSAAPRAGPQQPRAGDQGRGLGVRGDRQRRPPGGGHGGRGAVVVEVGPGHHHHRAGGGGGVLAGAGGEPFGVGPGDDPPQVGLGRFLGPGDQHRPAGHGHHLGDLQPRRGDGLAVDGEAAGVAGRVVGRQDQAAVQPGRHPTDEVDPGRVVLGGQLGGGPGAGVSGQDQGGRLVAGLHQQGRGSAGVPADRRQVGVGVPVPADLDPAAGQVDHVQAHLGVAGPGGQVGAGRA